MIPPINIKTEIPKGQYVPYYASKKKIPIILNRSKKVCEIHKTVKQQSPKWIKGITNFFRKHLVK